MRLPPCIEIIPTYPNGISNKEVVFSFKLSKELVEELQKVKAKYLLMPMTGIGDMIGEANAVLERFLRP